MQRIAHALAGNVLVNIGQVTPQERRQLDAEVRAGRLVRWPGYWHPIAGAPFGIGLLETCWSTPEVAEYLRSLKP